MNIQFAFIFDLDGVLIDTAKFHYLAWKKLSNQFGFDISIEQNELLKGISRIDSLNLLLKWAHITITDAEKTNALELKNRWFLEYIESIDEHDLLAGTKTFLELCKSKHIKIALGSSSKNAKLILQKTNIIHFFDAISDGNNVTLSKPNPEVFLKAAQFIKIKPIHCCVFEDAIAGIEAAISANMKSVGIGQKHILTKADLVFDNLEQTHFDQVINLFN